MKSSTKVNYWIDVTIGITLIASAVSGLVLFLVPGGGYKGGRNPGYGLTVFLMDYHAWTTVHTWSSIAMAAGALAHLVLHWNWLTCMTRRLIPRLRRTPDSATTSSCPNPTA